MAILKGEEGLKERMREGKRKGHDRVNMGKGRGRKKEGIGTSCAER
jgi:hypothetical protein